MSNKINDMEAYILAGGKSSRMGSDKGLLLLENKSMIERIIEQLQPLFEKIIIVSNNPEHRKFGLLVLPDMISDAGPAGGIYTALNNAKSESIFVTSCDMPFITKNAVRFIVSQSANKQITLFSIQEKMQPLFAVYQRSCLEKWEQLIHQKEIKLQEMAKHFDISIIDLVKQEFFNEKLLMNINDKNDLVKALQYL